MPSPLTSTVPESQKLTWCTTETVTQTASPEGGGTKTGDGKGRWRAERVINRGEDRMQSYCEAREGSCRLRRGCRGCRRPPSALRRAWAAASRVAWTTGTHSSSYPMWDRSSRNLSFLSFPQALLLLKQQQFSKLNK